MSVTFLPEIQEFFDELEIILYEKGYFSYEENARQYADDLFFDIKNNLPVKHHKPAPPYFDRYGAGMFYASFKKNRDTTWYAFFTKYLVDGETIYLVRYVSNNHMIAKYL